MNVTAHRYSLLRQLAWATTLACGFGLAWAVAVVLVGTWAQEAWQAPNRRIYETVMVRSDGEIIIQTYNFEDPSRSAYRDLKGQAQEAPGADNQVAPVSVPGSPPKTSYFARPLDWSSRLTSFADEKEPDVNWFFVRDGAAEGAGYFAAYDRRTNRRIGFLGLSGFRTDPLPSTEWIPVHGDPQSSQRFSNYSGRNGVYRPGRWDVPPRWVYLPSGSLLRKADLVSRTVTTFLQAPEPIVSVGVPWLAAWSVGHRTRAPHILARTAHEIQAIDLVGHVVQRFAIPTEIEPQSYVAWYDMDDGQAIAIVDNRLVYHIGADGAIRERFPLELESGARGENATMQASGLAFGCPSPAVLVGISLLIELLTAQGVQAAGMMLSRFWPWLILVFTFSSILAALTWRRCRSFGLSRGEQVSWAVFVLLFGIPAYVGFRLYRRWPVRLPCPSCQFRVPRDRDVCAQCNTHFPAPSVKGIEIFA